MLTLTLTSAGAAPTSPHLIVSLTFDDGYDNQATVAGPMLASHGMVGTFFVPSGFVGTSGYMTWSQVSGLAAAGNEIGGHTIHHYDLTSVSTAVAQQEVCGDRDTLLSHGLAVANFAYPDGHYNAALELIAQHCGYNSARTTSWNGATCWGPCTESIPPQDPYATDIVAFGGDQTLAAIESSIGTAEAYGGWAQILIHRVCDGCAKGAMSPADLSALLDWLQPRAAQGTVVETVAQAIGGGVNPAVSPTAASAPPAPTLTTATAGNGSVGLQWTAPAWDGGSAVTGYDVYRGTSSGGESLLAQVGNVTSYTDSTATNGTKYFYKVSAVNSVGEGAQSGELSALPGGWTVVASDQFQRSVAAGFGTPDVGPAWTVSSTKETQVVNGEGDIYGWTGGNQDVQASVPISASDMDVLGEVRLSAQDPVGANYQARVVARAQTDARNGYSAVITHTTAGAAKWSLQRVVSAGGTGTLSLGSGTLLASGAAGTKWWVRLDVQGTQIKVRFWQDGTTEPTTWKVSTTDSQWASGRAALGVYTGSALATPYPDTGFDSFTYSVLNFTPVVPTAPSLTNAAGSNGSVALQWSAPAWNGGSAVSGYDVYRGTSSGGETLLAQVGNVTNYTDASVTNGTTYYYEVSAVSSAGEGAQSGELSATPAGVASVIASDQFQRSVAAGFGTPDLGPAWGVSSTKQTQVANGEGVINGWTIGNRDEQAWIPVTANNMDVVARIRLSAQDPVGANYQARVVARAQADARNGYSAIVTHTQAGALRWSLQRVVNAGGDGTLSLGSGTLLASGAAGTKWWVRIDVQGTQIKARFWQDGTTEPATWKVSATDSQWASGNPALGVYVGSGLATPFPDTGFSNFTATALP
jgi:peptidoglycan/xylan/chitin deacetylase (PgdA/CDA1 family)